MILPSSSTTENILSDTLSHQKMSVKKESSQTQIPDKPDSRQENDFTQLPDAQASILNKKNKSHDANTSKAKVHKNETTPWAFDLWWAEHGRPSELLKQQIIYLVDYYQINPYLGDLQILYQAGQWIPHVTMDGWMKMINQHPSFCGIDFREANELIDGVPEWVSCTIYRNDRVIPITIREYYQEIKQESAVWLEIPRRLLRFRSMQQCARLALSLSTPEFSHQAIDTSGIKPPPLDNHKHTTTLEKVKSQLIK